MNKADDQTRGVTQGGGWRGLQTPSKIYDFNFSLSLQNSVTAARTMRYIDCDPPLITETPQ